MMVRADDKGRLAMNTVIQLFDILPNAESSLRNTWPLEQGALNSIYLTQQQRHTQEKTYVAPDEFVNQLGSDVDRVRRSIAAIACEEMNSQGGLFIRHVWGGSRENRILDGKDHRFDPSNEAFAQHIDDPKRFA